MSDGEMSDYAERVAREMAQRGSWTPPNEIMTAGPVPVRDVLRLTVEDLLARSGRSHTKRSPVIVDGVAVTETLKQRLTRELAELETAVTQIAGQMARRTRQLEQLNRFPEEDPFEDGTVLQFDKVFSHTPDAPYSYVAHRAAGRWYVTGVHSPQSATWEALVDWMGLGVETVYQLNPGGRVGRKKVIG